MVRDPPVDRDKTADPQPMGQSQNKWSFTYNVTPTPIKQKGKLYLWFAT